MKAITVALLTFFSMNVFAKHHGPPPYHAPVPVPVPHDNPCNASYVGSFATSPQPLFVTLNGGSGSTYVQLNYLGQNFVSFGYCDGYNVDFTISNAHYQGQFFFGSFGVAAGIQGWVTVPGSAPGQFYLNRR